MHAWPETESNTDHVNFIIFIIYLLYTLADGPFGSVFFNTRIKYNIR